MTVRPHRYILDGKTPVPCDNVIEWAEKFEMANRQVARDKIDDVTISTVFIGLDHQFIDGPPILFETMIFGGPRDGWQERCSTWDEAEALHKRALDIVRDAR